MKKFCTVLRFGGRNLRHRSEQVGVSLCFCRLAVCLIATLLLPSALAAAALSQFGHCSLRGDYVYENVGGDVASFGVLRFDGAGNVKADLRVNAAINGDGSSRKTSVVSAHGTYTVGKNGIGIVKLDFKGIAITRGVYDFVIRRSADDIGLEVFSVLRDGGVKAQLVDPVWNLRQVMKVTGCP